MATYTRPDGYYRHDGVRITHDPFAPGMIEKYGAPGRTDNEGFDPYADSVGAGIYGGIVQRDSQGNIVIGRQYQNHNPRPGPIYAGGGYAPSADALKDIDGKLVPLLDKFPDLVTDITTGGAQPLHMCGMSRQNQHAVSKLIEYGADIEALDTYGMTPLHRMASNNLAAGAAMLIAAGANPSYTGKVGATPMEMARQSRARDVVQVLRDTSAFVFPRVTVSKVDVMGAGCADVNGEYKVNSASTIPSAFDEVCQANGWDTNAMWTRLNGGNSWYQHQGNDSYLYFNQSDEKWWIDAPDGLGAYIASGPSHAPPAHGWTLLRKDLPNPQVPQLRIFRLPATSAACDDRSQYEKSSD